MIFHNAILYTKIQLRKKNGYVEGGNEIKLDILVCIDKKNVVQIPCKTNKSIQN